MTESTGFRGFFVCLAIFCLASTGYAAPHKPLDDNEVLERLPQRANDSVARELAELRSASAAAPTNPLIAARLSQAYFDLALARGDPRYIGYSEAVITRFAEPLPPQLRLVRGLLRQYRHDFATALDDFAGALQGDPDLAVAHAWRGAIFLVQADYAAAQQECGQLERLGRDSLSGGCWGLAMAYGGQLEAASRRLQLALAVNRDPGNRLWLLTRLGEVAAWRGQAANAERYFREALKLGRDDAYLLAAWGDFLLDEGRHAEVLKELAGWEASDSLLLRLAEAEAKLGRPNAARLAQALADRFAAARARGDTTHMAEEARFRLRLQANAKEAVRLAAENYRLQREPRDARVLFEAAIAARDADAAQPARDWLRASGFEDAAMRRLGQQSEKANKP